MATALAKLQAAAQNAPTSGKHRRISKKIVRAVELIESGACVSVAAAAQRVSMSREGLAKALGSPRVGAFLARRKRQTLSLGALRASERLTELLSAQSEKVSLEASRHLLSLDGFSPPSNPQIINNLNVLPGYEVVLPGRRFDAIEGQFKVVEPASDDAD